MKRLARSAGCLLLGLSVLLGGCRGRSRVRAAGAAGAASPGVVKAEVVRGPLSFRIKVDKERVRFDERLTVVLEASAPESYSFRFPAFGQGLEQFGITDYQTDEPALGKERTLTYRRTYFLDPLLEGKTRIPAVAAVFKDSAPPRRKHTLETEPFELEVVMPPKEFWQRLDIDDRTGMAPEESLHPDRARLARRAAALAAAGLALAAAGVLLAARRRRRLAPAPVIPAHVAALLALKKLLDDDLVAQGRVREFYDRISDILRLYIEDRFRLRAPELTTEEFLAQLASAQTLLKQHQQLLAAFLRFCDIVKFAAHRPEEQDIQRTFDACKSFIAATREAMPQ